MMNEPTEPQGQKDDAGKLEWDLLPWEAMGLVVRTFMYGTAKYGRDNWRLVEDRRRRYVNAAFRHIVDHQRGFYLDGYKTPAIGGALNPPPKAGSGMPHLAHAIASLLMALESEIEVRTAQDHPIPPPPPPEGVIKVPTVKMGNL